MFLANIGFFREIWLISFKVLGMTGKGNSVTGKGNSVTGKGNSVTGKGNSVTGKENGVTGKGLGVTGKGNSVTGKGHATIGNGCRPTFKANRAGRATPGAPPLANPCVRWAEDCPLSQP